MNFLQDHKGNSSSTRLMGMVVWFYVMTAWVFVTITDTALSEIPQSVIGVLGIAATWLAVNKHIESSTDKAAP
jgi:uncharacterized membrane-anchored protein